MPCQCPEDGGFGAVQPGLAVSFGTQRWFCNLKLTPGCGALPVQAGWTCRLMGRAIEGYEVLPYPMVLK